MYQRIEFQNIGKIIRQRRKEKKITQEKLAMISGIGIRFIRELENGKPTCQIEKVFRILNLMGIRLYYDDGASE